MLEADPPRPLGLTIGLHYPKVKVMGRLGQAPSSSNGRFAETPYKLLALDDRGDNSYQYPHWAVCIIQKPSARLVAACARTQEAKLRVR